MSSLTVSPQTCSIKGGQGGLRPGWRPGCGLNPADRCAPREGPALTLCDTTVPKGLCALEGRRGLDTQPKASLAAVPRAAAAASTLPLHLGTSPTALEWLPWSWNNPLHPQTLHQTLPYPAFAVSVPSEPPCLPLAPCQCALHPTLPAVSSSAFPISQAQMKILGLLTNESQLPQKLSRQA